MGDWDGSYEANLRMKRASWASTSPEARLRWLEDMLDLALASGALAEDRARRARAASAWRDSPAPDRPAAPPTAG